MFERAGCDQRSLEEYLVIPVNVVTILKIDNVWTDCFNDFFKGRDDIDKCELVGTLTGEIQEHKLVNAKHVGRTLRLSMHSFLAIAVVLESARNGHDASYLITSSGM